MALETATYISDLVSTNPTASDNISQGDDHIRLLKATVKASFPNVTGAMTRTHTDLNNAVTLTGSETLTNKSLTAPTITGTAILGAGNATATPVDAILAGASGSGTNIAGADIIVRAGNGTGTGGSGYIAFETAAAGSTGSVANTLTERMRIDNAGNVGIGTTSPSNPLQIYNATSSTVLVQGDSTASYTANRNSIDSTGPVFVFRKARGTTASPTAVASGDGSGNIQFQVYGGTNNRTIANIRGIVETYTSDADISGYLRFDTSPSGSAAAVERFRIGSSGQLGIGGANYGTSGQVLTSGGSGAAPSWADAAGGTPTGAVMPYAGSTAPSGWLLAAGQAVSRTTYAALFAVVSTTYGAGDGSTTFNLPDLRGRAPRGKDDMNGTAASRITSGGSGITGTTLGASGGAETVTLTTAQIPSHQHFVGRSSNSVSTGGSQSLPGSTTTNSGATGGDGAHNNIGPTIILNYIIKT